MDIKTFKLDCGHVLNIGDEAYVMKRQYHKAKIKSMSSSADFYGPVLDGAKWGKETPAGKQWNDMVCCVECVKKGESIGDSMILDLS